MNLPLLIGAILGLLSVIAAAYVDHSLALHLTGKQLSSVLTAVKYHQLYSIVISMIGVTLPLQINNMVKSWLVRSTYLFSIGIILFSFSIYISSLFDLSGVLYLTPVGGIILMTGWVGLIRTASLNYIK
jgi:uncharacterized membrane protein YgdD (TMEM256/DUF423 family)